MEQMMENDVDGVAVDEVTDRGNLWTPRRTR